MWKWLRKILECPEPPVSDKEDDHKYGKNDETVSDYLSRRIYLKGDAYDIIKTMDQFACFAYPTVEREWCSASKDYVDESLISDETFKEVMDFLASKLVPGLDLMKLRELFDQDRDKFVADMRTKYDTDLEWCLDKISGLKGVLFDDVKVMTNNGTWVYLQDITAYDMRSVETWDGLGLTGLPSYNPHCHSHVFSRVETSLSMPLKIDNEIISNVIPQHRNMTYGEYIDIYYEFFGPAVTEYLKRYSVGLTKLYWVVWWSYYKHIINIVPYHMSSRSSVRSNYVNNKFDEYLFGKKTPYGFISIADQVDTCSVLQNKHFVSYRIQVNDASHNVTLPIGDDAAFRKALDDAKRSLRNPEDER